MLTAEGLAVSDLKVNMSSIKGKLHDHLCVFNSCLKWTMCN
jgi:hypothetical protein